MAASMPGALLRATQLQMQMKEPVQRVEVEELLQGKLKPVPGGEEDASLQGQFAQARTSATAPAASVQREEAPGNAGLPNQLKSGIESLSGMSMDHVRVHYNSPQPAQLNAHAYAQGSEIHLAPGQEQHLPHEAWHVVQQAQGRVAPTMQMKHGVNVNDEPALETEADMMGARAALTGRNAEAAPAMPTMPGSQSEVVRQNQVVQLDRLYDATLAPHKAKLLEWLVEENRTLGLSQAGDSKDVNANKKSNFSWHHVLAFSELSPHGEKKSDPANHGGNVRLGPMKNRFEAYDVSGGTAVDYSYLPLDKGENIVLDEYSQGIYDETIKATDKSSLINKLPHNMHDKTPQAEGFKLGKKADAFGEWFLEKSVKNDLLSKKAIAGQLVDTNVLEIDRFVKEIDTQFDNLLRTYKFYNKKKEVQTTSGVPMTDISEGNFGQIVIKKGVKQEEVTASAVIDNLLRGEKWINRGSQGVILDEWTSYKFGLAEYAPFTAAVEHAAELIDLSEYKDKKLKEFKLKLSEEFERFRETGKQGAAFEEEKENALIDALVTNLKDGEASYDSLWKDVEDEAVDGQYVKVNEEENDENWSFPVPDTQPRRSAITETTSSKDSEVKDKVREAWQAIFVSMLKKWDKKTSLFGDDSDLNDLTRDDLYIYFDDVEESINKNEKKWKIGEINRARQDEKKAALPKSFLTDELTLDNVRDAVASELNEERVSYLSSEKTEMTLSDMKDELKTKLTPHFNVFFKLVKGVNPDLAIRKQAFGPIFTGFVNRAKWNVINQTKMPTGVKGAEGKKWGDLGEIVQGELYSKWLEQANVETLIAGAATSTKLIETLP
ncbi:hypothetical protein GCM10011396_25230 [Undibacterium terreum]|uniref:eCIS core domain-containing protein n=2 Tax=Undibacterium terreum TaxID=1224302 RepID=A0A916XJN3_9BURK|nr:hypothetical protein GCM10011396_25230 [Undibacterium terreum]